MSVGLGRKGKEGKMEKKPVRRRGRKQSMKERETGPVRWRGRRVGRANEWIGGDGGVGGFMVDGARKGRGKRETKEREFG